MSLFGPLAGILQQQAPAAGGDVVPSDIATLAIWFDASDSGTVTASGNDVTAWSDKSANGYDLTVRGAPQTGTRTVNSLNAIDVSSGNNFYRTAPTLINNASDGSWTAFAVVVLDSTTGTQKIVDGDDEGSIRVAQYIRQEAGTAQSVGFITNTTASTDSGGSLSTATAYLLRSVQTGTTIEMFVDGSSGGSTAQTSQRYLTTTRFGLGGKASVTAGSQMDGLICEVAVYSSALSADDISDLETYFSNKWGTA